MAVILLTSAATSWQVPFDWSSTNTINLLGSGASGFAGGTSGTYQYGGHGGGGGGYSKFTNIAYTAGSVFPVNVGSAGAASTNATSINGTLVNQVSVPQIATYTVTPVSGGCTGASFTVTVTVNPIPMITNMSATVCSGNTFTVTPVDGTTGVIPAGTTYSWVAPVVTGNMSGGTSGSGTSITGTITNPTNTAQTATYTVIPSAGGCTGSPFNVTVTVNLAPAAPAISGPITYCQYATTVQLTATPLLGSLFTGWSGATCSGNGICTVTMNAANTVTATFTTQTFGLTASIGSGSGTISATGLTCSVSGCTGNYNYGTSVVITAAPSAGYTASWTVCSW